MSEKTYLKIFNANDISLTPINYRLLSETGGDKRFISFCYSSFYQSNVFVKDYYKSIISTKKVAR